PSAISAPNGNAFYKKVIASAGHVDLLDARGVDIYTDTLHFIGSVRDPGVVDAAASDAGLFTVSSNLTVRSYAPDGFLRSTAAISEGADAQALAISAVGGAVWVSIIRGCTSGG